MAQCTTLRSELHLMRKKLRETEDMNDRLHSDLMAAEVRADRLQSPTVLAMQARAAVEREEPKGEEKVEEPEQKLPSPPPVSGLVLIGGSFDHSDPRSFSKSIYSAHPLMTTVNMYQSRIIGRNSPREEKKRSLP
jgi:hypothetical protein